MIKNSSCGEIVDLKKIVKSLIFLHIWNRRETYQIIKRFHESRKCFPIFDNNTNRIVDIFFDPDVTDVTMIGRKSIDTHRDSNLKTEKFPSSHWLRLRRD